MDNNELYDDLIRVRIQKTEKLRSIGIEPYPYRFDRTHRAAGIIDRFDELESTETNVRFAGRIIRKNNMGKAFFVHILDETGRIQVYIRKDNLTSEEWEAFQLLDMGDFIGVEGPVFRTKTKEITIKADSIEVLSKSIRPLPVVKEVIREDSHSVIDAVTDKEHRYRQRYVDLVVNPEVREVFATRARIIRIIRQFLYERDFMEVETPTLQTVYGGAAARPFKTFHNSLGMNLYLKISPELYLKRLIVGGMDRVYEMSRTFRNEGIDRTHNPEFLLLELYQAYADYNDMMDLVENLFETISLEVHGSTEVEFNGKILSFKRPWERIPMEEAIRRYANLDVRKMDDSELEKHANEHGFDSSGEFIRGLAVNHLFEELVEHHLEHPTFITDYPKETSPLCKGKRGDSRLIERFEPFIAGVEFGNAYSELNDPVIQRRLLENQAKGRQVEGEIQPMDEDFVRAVEYGMPPVGGLGLGIDRIVMIFTGQLSIRDVILFPHLRPEEGRKLREPPQSENTSWEDL